MAHEDPDKIDKRHKRWLHLKKFRVIESIKGTVSFHLLNHLGFGRGHKTEEDRKHEWEVLEESLHKSFKDLRKVDSRIVNLMLEFKLFENAT